MIWQNANNNNKYKLNKDKTHSKNKIVKNR